MSALSFTNQEDRLRRILHNALDGTVFDSSDFEDDAMLVINAHRSDGTSVSVRFRAVQDSLASEPPQPGASLRVKAVDSGGWKAAFKASMRGYARVRIEAGAAKLDIICQDAEWWQVEPPKGGQA